MIVRKHSANPIDLKAWVVGDRDRLESWMQEALETERSSSSGPASTNARKAARATGPTMTAGTRHPHRPIGAAGAPGSCRPVLDRAL